MESVRFILFYSNTCIESVDMVHWGNRSLLSNVSIFLINNNKTPILEHSDDYGDFIHTKVSSSNIYPLYLYL